jgi:DNA-binding MarR family transcriptional regulator
MVKSEPASDNPPDVHELAARLNTTIVHMHRHLRRLDSDLDLPSAQASALAVLVSAGPHTIGALASIELVASPTMTRIVTALEARGLITRTRTSNDLRVVSVEATAAGKALISRALSNRLEQLAAGLAGLTPGQLRDIETAIDLLTRIRRTPDPEGG